MNRVNNVPNGIAKKVLNFTGDSLIKWRFLANILLET
jgi:hypothetical protein